MHRFVCACACHVSYGNENKISSRNAQGCCDGGRCIHANPHFLGILKATTQPRLQQQQRYNRITTAAPARQSLISGLCDSQGVVVFTLCVCSVQGIIFVHAPNHYYMHRYLFPRTSTMKKKHTSSNLILRYSSIPRTVPDTKETGKLT